VTTDEPTQPPSERPAPEVIWLRPHRPTRGPHPAYSRDDIAAAAVRIADADGLDAVSMRRVAAEIGAGTMSLYRYVPRKDDLLALMIDAVGAEYALPDAPSSDWRADLLMLARQGRALVHRHPWLRRAASMVPSFGPNSLRTVEFFLAALDGSGLDGTTKMELFGLLNGLALSYGDMELAQAETLQRAGITAEQYQAAQVAYLQSIAASGKYPRFASVIAEGGPARDADASFEHIVNRLLDAVVARPVR
jgi:AcrR family transcriptional regulator